MFTSTSFISAALLFPTLSLAATPFFILAGDSTTASNRGDAFITNSLKNGSSGKNYAVPGTTTITFDSDWNEYVLPGIAAVKANGYHPYVTIQFGLNDQVNNDAMAVFMQNLETFIKEAEYAGATPLILTSLSRRTFDTSVVPPVVVDDLANVREGAIAATEQVGGDYADLNTRSREYLNAIGPENAATYNLDGTDVTHLSAAGGVVFGGVGCEVGC
jgi:lysophospholipase L1-like esterase